MDQQLAACAAPALALLSYVVLLASQSVWMPVLMSLVAVATGSKAARGASSGPTARSSGGSHHQTVHVSVGQQEAAVEAAPSTAKDTHTLPCMYAVGAAAMLGVASQSAVDDGAVAAVGASAAVAALFVAKLTARFGSPCAATFAAAAVLGQAYVLATHATPK